MTRKKWIEYCIRQRHGTVHPGDKIKLEEEITHTTMQLLPRRRRRGKPFSFWRGLGAINQQRNQFAERMRRFYDPEPPPNVTPPSWLRK
jgi:hypothetical protein